MVDQMDTNLVLFVLIKKQSINYETERYEDNSNKSVYVCKVCGFEYVGDLDKEPDDYKCPICSMQKTAFEKNAL